MEDTTITLAGLLSMPVNIAAVGLTIQVLKIIVKPIPFIPDPTNAQIRSTAVILGMVYLITAALVLASEIGFAMVVSAVFGGMGAGLAASQVYEIGKDGLGHVTQSFTPHKQQSV